MKKRTEKKGGASRPAEPPPKTRRNDGDRDLDDALDEALENTFPASDPIAVRKKKKR